MKQKIFVIKRTGKKVPFDKAKIALAIKKGFENTLENVDFEEIEKDANLATEEVISRLDGKDSFTVDEITLIVEDVLKEKYPAVYETYHNYRLRRDKSREVFKDDKRLHKFLKSIESLASNDAKDVDAKRENANINGNTAMGSMLHLGSTLSKEFVKAYKMNPKYADLHDDGYIHIHDMDFMLMGTTTCMQIDLEKLFKDGFDTGHGFLRTPNDIMSYGALTAIAIQSNQNEQHGGQSIPALDYFLAPGVLKTFKKQFKQTLSDMCIAINASENELNEIIDLISKLETIKINNVNEWLEENNVKIEDSTRAVLSKAYNLALRKTDRITYQSMEALIHNLNTLHSRCGSFCVSMGTNI